MPGKRPPELSPTAVSSLLLQYFSFKHIARDSIKSLPSYDDRNIFFRGRRKTANGARDDGFVLKVLNSGISTYVAEGMNAMMLFLSDRGIPCSRPIPTRQGDYILTASERDLATLSPTEKPAAEPNSTYAVRVLTFVPGIPMDKLDKRYLTPELAYSVGEMVGKTDLALQVCYHRYM